MCLRILPLLFILFCVPITSVAKIADEFGLGTGMAMISFTENESTLQGENIDEASSGSFSSISSALYWKFFHRDRFDAYASALIPVMGGAGNSVIGIGGGVEYYLSNENHRISENINGLKLYIDPKLKYYLLGEVNLLFLSYLTETSQKNDINVELSAGGGATYSLSGEWKDWGIRGSVLVGRGLGAITSSFNVKTFASVIYYLDV